MTNVLMLRNLQNIVTAGLSGLTTLPAGASTADTSLSGTDNVLLWGGGSYEEAFYAANNANYYKSSNGTNPITTLIKKDGTGKIGIFKISDTQAIVDVPNQGTVVIDASTDNGGIMLYDSNNAKRVVISPKNLEDTNEEPEEVQNISKTSGQTSISSSSSKAYSYGSFSTPRTTNISFTVKGKGKLQISSLYLKVWGKSTTWAGTSLDNTSMKFKVGICKADETVVYSTSEWELPDSATDGSTSFSSATVTLSAGTYYVCVLSATKSNLGDTRPVSGSVTGTVQTNARFVPDYSAKTIICKNGLVSANDAEHYFKVQNTDDGQKIYARGLAPEKGTADSGELYVSSNFIEAFKDLCNALKELFPLLRTVGNNETNADVCTQKVETLLNNLEDTNLIASS